MNILINISYIIAAIFFIYGIKMLGSAETARRGNQLSAVGMLLALVVTLINQNVFGSWYWIAAGIGIGALIGGVAAARVQMTGMPELVALFNGSGGLASLLVGWAEFDRLTNLPSAELATLSSPLFTAAVIFLTILIGGVTATGSVYAWGKLSGRMDGTAKVFTGQKQINLALAAAILLLLVGFTFLNFDGFGYALLVLGVILSLILGCVGRWLWCNSTDCRR